MGWTRMSQWPAQSQIERQSAQDAASASARPSLNAAIRRHLGSNLRTLYASLPAKPWDARIAALLARLDKARV